MQKCCLLNGCVFSDNMIFDKILDNQFYDYHSNKFSPALRVTALVFGFNKKHHQFFFVVDFIVSSVVNSLRR